MGPVLAHAYLGAFVNQLLHQSSGATSRIWVPTIVDDHDDVVHLPPAGTERREIVESPFLMQPLCQVILLDRVLSRERADGAERRVRAVGQPHHPVELPQIRRARVDLDSAPEIRVLRRLLRKHQLRARDSTELLADHLDIGVPQYVWPVHAQIQDPAEVAHP